jgi:hypothetical protein
MKKLAILFLVSVVVLVCSNAQNVDFDKLKAAHIAAMKYHGHAPLLAQRDQKMVFLSFGKEYASAFYGKDIATAYLEKGDVKLYWYVEKIEGGVMLTIKLVIKGMEFKRSFKITMAKGEYRVADLNWDEPSRLSIDWKCVMNTAFECISCGTDFSCWLSCAGPKILQCVSF